MALLTVKKRKEYFKALGLGEYNEENIKALQKRYMLRKSDADGKYGTNTDNLLRHLWNCHLYLKPENFKPEEFRCGCNGRHCCGYPTYMKAVELKNVQAIRTHFGKPMTITCGIRDPEYNREVGGIPNSEHKKGLAVDYHIKGVTDTLANRKSNIAWISKLPGHHYTYGDGIFIETANGKTSRGYVSAPGMGNAMHTDSREAASPYDEDGKLICDGSGGPATVKEMQRFFGTAQDGVISGQNKKLAKYFPALTAVKYGSGGSPCINNLQRWVGTKADGVLGEKTIRAWQKKIGVAVDGIFGAGSMKAWQKYLNEHKKAEYPAKEKEIATLARSFCGSPTKETAAYKKAALEVYGKGNDTYCHRFVGTVLAKCGLPKMDYSGKTAEAWKKIISYLRKYCQDVTGETPQEGDIHVTENTSGGKHIFIELGGGKKAEANSKKKYYPHEAKTNNGHKNWLFRVK